MAKRKQGLFDRWLRRTEAGLKDGVDSLRTPAGLDSLAETVEVTLHSLEQEHLRDDLAAFLSSVVQSASFDGKARKDIAAALPSLLSAGYMKSLVSAAGDDPDLSKDIGDLLAGKFREWRFRGGDVNAPSDDPVTSLIAGMTARRLLGKVTPPKGRKSKGTPEPDEGAGPLEFKDGFGFLSDLK